MFKEMWKEIPSIFKLIWVGGATVTLGIIIFIAWVVVKVMQHFGVI